MYGGPKLILGAEGMQYFQFLIQIAFDIQMSWWSSKQKLVVPELVFGPFYVLMQGPVSGVWDCEVWGGLKMVLGCFPVLFSWGTLLWSSQHEDWTLDQEISYSISNIPLRGKSFLNVGEYEMQLSKLYFGVQRAHSSSSSFFKSPLTQQTQQSSKQKIVVPEPVFGPGTTVHPLTGDYFQSLGMCHLEWSKDFFRCAAWPQCPPA